MSSTDANSLWAHDNLYAWCITHWDTKARDPQERARMLHRLGFRHFAADWRNWSQQTIPDFDAEIKALKEYGINLLAWWFLHLEPNDPAVSVALEAFARHNVQPQLWVEQSWRNFNWQKFLPPGANWRTMDDAACNDVMARIYHATNPQATEEYWQRVEREADRIKAFVDVAAPYGCKVELYNHGQWFGRIENQLAILARLQELGITNVGIVYNFIDARDNLHDDTRDFHSLWRRIQPHVDAVNLTGVGNSRVVMNLSQGDSELEMMRVIQQSGWHGPVGLYAHDETNDAEITLRNRLQGVDWLVAELETLGSGGPRRTFDVVPRR
jgi:hypothetical protein